MKRRTTPERHTNFLRQAMSLRKEVIERYGTPLDKLMDMGNRMKALGDTAYDSGTGQEAALDFYDAAANHYKIVLPFLLPRPAAEDQVDVSVTSNGTQVVFTASVRNGTEAEDVGDLENQKSDN